MSFAVGVITEKHYNRGIRCSWKLFGECNGRNLKLSTLSFSDEVVQLLFSLRRDLTIVNAERFLSQAAVVNVRQSFVDFTASNHWSYCRILEVIL